MCFKLIKEHLLVSELYIQMLRSRVFTEDITQINVSRCDVFSVVQLHRRFRGS